MVTQRHRRRTKARVGVKGICKSDGGYGTLTLALVRLTAIIASTTILEKKSISGPISLDDLEVAHKRERVSESA